MACLRPGSARTVGLFLLGSLFAVGPLGAAEAAPLSEDDHQFFEKQIRPLLAEHCYQCHSDRAERLKGGLRLDSAAAWQHGGIRERRLFPVNRTRAA